MVVMKKYCNKFTLVEILAVVALIGILTAIGFGAYTYAMNSAKESSTKALIKRLESGLESCRTKLGYFPASATAGEFNIIIITKNTDGIITKINFKGTDTAADFMTGDYVKEFLKVVEPESLNKYLDAKSGSNDSYILKDAWGQQIQYSYPGHFNKTGFDIVSSGADGKYGDKKTSPKDASKDEADDIGNF